MAAVGARSMRCRWSGPHFRHGKSLHRQRGSASGTPRTRHRLRTRFVTVYPDVYVPAGAELTAVARAKAAWLWTRREGIVAGQSAAALHGAKWVAAARPAEVLWHNRRAPRALRVWSDQIADDEVEVIRGDTCDDGRAYRAGHRVPLSAGRSVRPGRAARRARGCRADRLTRAGDRADDGRCPVTGRPPPRKTWNPLRPARCSTSSTPARSRPRRRGCGCW